MTGVATLTLVAMAAIGLTAVPSSANTTGMCTLDDFLKGILYYGMSHQCEKFVQCDQLNPVVMSCPYALLWDPKDLTCVPAADSSCNPCQGAADNAEVTYGLQCNTYWRCQGQVPFANCCPTGFAFSQGSGCVPDASCTAPCPSSLTTTVTSPAPCPFQVSSSGSTFYQQFQSGLGWVDRPCPTGTRYTQSSCGCHTIESSESYVCGDRLLLSFQNGNYVDQSMHKQWPQISNVQIVGGVPVFNGINSEVAVFGLNHVPLSPNVVISVTFLPSDLAPSSAKRILLQLGSCAGAPDIIIFVTGTEASGFSVSFAVRGRNSVASTTLQLPPNSNVLSSANIELPFASDPSKIYFEVQDKQFGLTVASTTEDFSGSLVRNSHGGLYLGNGDCTTLSNDFAPFSGNILEARITTCNYGEV